MKRCSTCKEFRNLDNFHRNYTKYDELQTSCKDCQRLHHKKEKTKLKARQTRLKNDYGVSVETFDYMFEKQNGVCAICLEPGSPLEVDHNHKTGIVRGLLCWKCSRGLGFFQDNIGIICNAVDYLSA